MSDVTNISRRAYLRGTATVIATISAVSTSVSGSISYTIETIRTIEDGTVEQANGYSYDLYEWDGTGVLEFQDNAYIEFGDENPAPDQPGIDGAFDDLDWPGDITLPLRVDFRDMQMGVSVFLVGVLGSLFGVSYLFRNPAAGIATAFALVVLVMSGLFGLGLEMFWLIVLAAAILIVVGLAARWGT